MIILIIIGAIVAYVIWGFVTAKISTLLDPSIFHDQFAEALHGESETSVPLVTITILFWPIAFALIIIVIISVMIHHTLWKWWGNLVKKAVG